MNKELKALEQMGYYHLEMGVCIRDLPNYEIIEKSLKALEIIKETPIFAWYVTIYNDVCEMVADAKGFRVNNSVEELQQMFDLLKEVLL